MKVYLGNHTTQIHALAVIRQITHNSAVAYYLDKYNRPIQRSLYGEL